MRKRKLIGKCQWPGCGEKAKCYLKGLKHEHLCVLHAHQIINSPEMIEFRSAIEEAETATVH